MGGTVAGEPPSAEKFSKLDKRRKLRRAARVQRTLSTATDGSDFGVNSLLSQFRMAGPSRRTRRTAAINKHTSSCGNIGRSRGWILGGISSVSATCAFFAGGKHRALVHGIDTRHTNLRAETNLYPKPAGRLRCSSISWQESIKQFLACACPAILAGHSCQLLSV